MCVPGVKHLYPSFSGFSLPAMLEIRCSRTVISFIRCFPKNQTHVPFPWVVYAVRYVKRSKNNMMPEADTAPADPPSSRGTVDNIRGQESIQRTANLPIVDPVAHDASFWVTSQVEFPESSLDCAADGLHGHECGLALLPQSQEQQQQHQDSPPFAMAPPPRRLVSKDRFAYAFGTLKTQSYHDPAARGPGSHTYDLTVPAEERNALANLFFLLFQYPNHCLESNRPISCDGLCGSYTSNLEPRATSCEILD